MSRRTTHATNQDLHNLWYGKEELGNLTDSPELLWAISYNLRLIKPEIDKMQESAAFSPEMAEKDEAFRNLYLQYRLRNPRNEQINKHGMPPIDPDKLEEFEIKRKELQDKYAPVIEARDKQNEEINKTMNKNAGVTLYIVSLKLVPKSITGRQMELIFPMIDAERDL